MVARRGASRQRVPTRSVGTRGEGLMLRLLAVLLPIGAAVAGAVLYRDEVLSKAPVLMTEPPALASSILDVVDEPLYPRGALPAPPIPRPTTTAEPVIVPECRLTVIEKQNVP